MHRSIVYIDGFNLYYGLKSKGWRRYYWLDIHKIALSILRPHQKLTAVKYFTARISANPGSPGKHKRQATFLDVLETLPDTKIYYGHYLTKSATCRNCGYTWDIPEEKMTDVNISVQMVTDAFNNNFDTAFLVSGDSDLAAPVETILQCYPEKRVIVVSPPNRQSRKLKSLATGYINLGEALLRNNLLPDTYIRPDGMILTRPPQWK